MSGLSVKKYTFMPTDETVLPTMVNRYWRGPTPKGGFTFICAHCTTSHKEAYEPFIEDLYEALPEGYIHEVWAIEHPNHGEAAVLNEATLLAEPYAQQFKWDYGARTIHAFLNGLGTGVDVDFSKRRVVGLAQSSGSSLLTLAMSIDHQTSITPEHLFIIEPITGPLEYTQTLAALVDTMNSTISNRRDVWPSRKAAKEDLQQAGIWKYYDKRVFDLYMKHALRDLPTMTHKGTGVTLACTLAQEVAIQSDFVAPNTVFEVLPQLSRRTALHLVWSKIHHPMLLPLEMKTQANEKTCPASVLWVDGPHLLLQLNPRGVAKAVADELTCGFYQEVEWESAKM